MTLLRSIQARALVLLAATLLLGGCVTPYGGYPGGGTPSGYPGGGYGSERVLGTVQDVDPYNGRMLLSADDRYGRVSRVEVRFQRDVPTYYRGQRVAAEGLERGDRVSVDATYDNGRLWARRIEVVHNVRDSHGGSYYGGDLNGAVSYVDAQRRIIVLTRGGYSGTRENVYYDANTMVEYQGRLFRPDQLERGDIIRIQARPAGNREWIAERIWVDVDVRSR
jgi:hypothetical protein